MKKYSLSVICVVLFALLAGCGNKETSNITVDYGDSAVYTEQDMDDAIKVIEEMIGSWEGCELHSISYSSDDVCTDEKNLSWMNDLEKANDNDLAFTQCIMFDSSFRSPKEGGGGLGAGHGIHMVLVVGSQRWRGMETDDLGILKCFPV